MRRWITLLMMALLPFTCLADPVLLFPLALANGQFTSSPATYDFGQACFSNASSFVLTLTNTTGVSVQGGSATIPDGSGYSITSGNPFTIAPHGTTNVTIRFFPTLNAPLTGTNIVAHVVTSATGTPIYTNTIQGTAFGSLTGSFTISNPTGAVPNTATFTSSQNSQDIFSMFSSGDVTNLNVAGSGSAYTYTVPGTYSVTMIQNLFGYQYPCPTIVTSTCVNCIVATGTVAGSFIVLPNSYNVGNVCIGTTSTVVFVASNLTGSAISGGTLTILNGSGYSVVAGSNFTIGATPAKTNVTIQVIPTSVGPTTASVVFATTSAGIKTQQFIANGVNCGICTNCVSQPTATTFPFVATSFTNLFPFYGCTNIGAVANWEWVEAWGNTNLTFFKCSDQSIGERWCYSFNSQPNSTNYAVTITASWITTNKYQVVLLVPNDVSTNSEVYLNCSTNALCGSAHMFTGFETEYDVFFGGSCTNGP